MSEKSSAEIAAQAAREREKRAYQFYYDTQAQTSGEIVDMLREFAESEVLRVIEESRRPAKMKMLELRAKLENYAIDLGEARGLLQRCREENAELRRAEVEESRGQPEPPK